MDASPYAPGACEPVATVPLLLDALAFAAAKHRNQRRKDVDASPYINHPIALARVLAVEAGVAEPATLAAALLHDTLEDTETTHAELVDRFGPVIADLVAEVTDDRSLTREARKAAQIAHAAQLSPAARRVKLADKICNLRDVAEAPPADWDTARRRAYFDWAKQVIDALRGHEPILEALFDRAYGQRPPAD